jgi:WD40 repeat protein
MLPSGEQRKVVRSATTAFPVDQHPKRGVKDMADEWYYRNSTGQEKGPVTAQKLKQLAELGRIEPDNEVKKGPEGRWTAASKVKGLLDAAPPKPTATKTARPSWKEPLEGGEKTEPAQPRPKSPAPLVRRPPVDDEDDRPVTVGRTSPSNVTSPDTKRSPLLIVGICAGGLLMVVIALAVMMSGQSDDKKVAKGPEPSGLSNQQKQAQQKQAQEADEQRRKADQERAAKADKDRAAKEEADQNAKEIERQKYEAWLKSGKEIGQFIGSEDSWFGGVKYSNAITFSPTGKYVAAVSNSKKFSPLTYDRENPDYGDTAIYVWDAHRREVVHRFSPLPYKPEMYTDYRYVEHNFTSISFSKNDRLLASGRLDGTVRVWDVAKGNEIASFMTSENKTGKSTDKINTVAFSPDGDVVLAAGWTISGKATYPVRLWRVADGGVMATLTGHSDVVICSAFSPEGRYAVTGSWDRTAIVWDVNSGKEYRQLDAHSKWVTAVAFSPDGTKILTGSDDKTVRLWDVASGRELFSVNIGSPVTSISMRAGGKLAVVGTEMGPASFRDSTVDSNPVMIDLDKGSIIKLPTAFMKRPLQEAHVTVSPDGKSVLFNAKQLTRIRGRDVETNYLTLRELPE